MDSLLRLCSDRGSTLALDAHRWHAPASAAEQEMMGKMGGPVLDVGCGPGRLVVGLGHLGVPALGIDPSPGAVWAARSRGATVLQRSVFDPLPREGHWQSVLLVDGNIGIGGDPVRPLGRCRHLLTASGTVLVETSGPGAGYRAHRVRLEQGNVRSPWFPWAEVAIDTISDLAGQAGLAVELIEALAGESRWFAYLTPRHPAVTGMPARAAVA